MRILSSLRPHLRWLIQKITSGMLQALGFVLMLGLIVTGYLVYAYSTLPTANS